MSGASKTPGETPTDLVARLAAKALDDGVWEHISEYLAEGVVGGRLVHNVTTDDFVDRTQASPEDIDDAAIALMLEMESGADVVADAQASRSPNLTAGEKLDRYTNVLLAKVAATAIVDGHHVYNIETDSIMARANATPEFLAEATAAYKRFLIGRRK